LFGSVCACPADAARRIGGVAADEMSEIAPVIRTATSECILYFRRLDKKTIEVETGDSGYQGVGEVFRVRYSKGKWNIVETLLWNA